MKFPIHLMVFALLLVCGKSAQAQIEQVLRKDIEWKEDGLGRILPIGAKGVLIHGPAKDSKQDDWKIRHLNAEFEEIKTVTFEVPKNYKLVGTVPKADNSQVYFLLVEKKGAYLLKTFDVDKGVMKSVAGKFPMRFSPSELVLLNASLFVQGKAKKSEVLFRIDTHSGSNKLVILPGLGKDLSIQDVAPQEAQGVLAVSVRYGKSRKVIENTFEICFYDEQGEQLRRPFRIENEPMRTTLNAQVSWLGEDHFIFSGSYSSDKNFASNGLYMAEFKAGKQVFIKYHNFQNMENFSSYLPEKQKAKAEKRIEKRKAKGKENAISIAVITHPLFDYNGQYVLVAEAYHATHTTYTTTTFINGTPTTQYHTVFDGYQYTHAVVLGLDRTGNKLWDHSFEMRLVNKPFRPVLHIEGLQTEEDIRLLFANMSAIKSLLIKNDNSVVEQDLGKIDLVSDKQEVKRTSVTNAQYWYDDYFLVYGTQRIKGSEDGKSSKRTTVFFTSKVRVNATRLPEKAVAGDDD